MPQRKSKVSGENPANSDVFIVLTDTHIIEFRFRLAGDPPDLPGGRPICTRLGISSTYFSVTLMTFVSPYSRMRVWSAP